MIYLDEVCWTEAMLRGLLEDLQQAQLTTSKLQIQVTQQAADIVRGKIDINQLLQKNQQASKENEALRSLVTIDRQRAQDAASHERHWRAEVVQLKYKIEALQATGLLLPIDRKRES